MQHIQVPLAYVVTDTHKIGCLAFGKRPIPYIDYVVGSTCSANTTVTVLPLHTLSCIFVGVCCTLGDAHVLTLTSGWACGNKYLKVVWIVRTIMCPLALCLGMYGSLRLRMTFSFELYMACQWWYSYGVRRVV